MVSKRVSLVVCVALSGCIGNEVEFFGATPVTLNPDGSVVGTSGEQLTVVDTAAGSFGHGFIQGVDATVIGNSSGAAAGDTGNFAAAGIIDGFDVGANYLSGTASYTGEYAMTVVTGYEQRPGNPNAWNTEVLSGPLTARIELHTAVEAENDPDHGHSHNVDVVELFIGSEGDVLYFDEVIIYSPTPPAQPSTTVRSFNGGVANVGANAPVDLDGQIAFGGDGLIATFRGTDRDTLVAGGFGLGATDTSQLQTD